MGVQSDEILKLKVAFETDGRHSTWASVLFPLVGENKNQAEDVDVCLKAGRYWPLPGRICGKEGRDLRSFTNIHKLKKSQKRQC